MSQHDNKPIYLGVVGFPAFHSLSPAMHNAVMKKLKISGAYLAFEVENFEKAVHSAVELGFRGLNVTLPYKELAYKIADETSEEVSNIKSANTLLFIRNKSRVTIKAFNTDIYGFEESIKKTGFKLEDSTIAVIGTGGVSRSIVYSSAKNNAKKIVIFGRTLERAEKIKEDTEHLFKNSTIDIQDIRKIDFEEFDIIVNATSVGWKKGENLFDIIGKLPTKRRKGKPQKLFYDTIYVPTEFQKIAKSYGYITQDGLLMLVLQGKKSFEIWTGLIPDEKTMLLSAKKELKRRLKLEQ